jgi:hypothetical protein
MVAAYQAPFTKARVAVDMERLRVPVIALPRFGEFRKLSFPAVNQGSCLKAMSFAAFAAFATTQSSISQIFFYSSWPLYCPANF